MAPLFPLGQATLVVMNEVDSNVGSVMVKGTEVIQPLSSAILKEYDPALRPVTGPSPTYGAVPPDAMMEISASPPLQAIGTSSVYVPVSKVGSVTIMDDWTAQPLASVTVNVCVPADTVNCPAPE